MNRQKHKPSRRILAVLLMAAMLITMFPSAMFAAGEESGETSTVAMDNMILRTNQAAKLSYTVPESIDESQLEFKADNPEVTNVYKNNSGIWYAGYDKQGISEGTTDTIRAYYNEEEVGSCSVFFANLGESVYKDESGSELSQYGTTSIPFATSTAITAFLPELSNSEVLSGAVVKEWRWAFDAEESVAAISVDNTDSSKARVTYFQKASGNTISAVPVITVDENDYIYNYGSTRRLNCSKLADGETNIVSTSAEAFRQGESANITFNLPESLTENGVEVTWTSSNDEVLKVPSETGTTITATAPRVSPIEDTYKMVTVTASAEIDGHIYQGSVDLWIYKVSIEADESVTDWESFKTALDSDTKTIDVEGTVTIPANTTVDLSGVQVLRPTGFGAALFNVEAEGVKITSDGTGVIDAQYNGSTAPIITVGADGELTLENVVLQNANHNSTDGDENSQGGAVSVDGGMLTCTNVQFNNNKVQGNAEDENYYNGGGAIYATNAVLNVANSKFTDNAAIFGNGGAIYADQGTNGTLSGNTIIGGEAQKTKGDTDGFGGGIYCRLAGNLTIENNSISECEADNDGGGIAILTTEGDGIGTIILKANTISNNTSDERGGGLYLVQDKANTIDLQSGTISGNKADWGGGIDYTVHDQETLNLTNVLIIGNTAVRGAGIWACPTAETESYATLGGAIYGNTATGQAQELNPLYASGDDIRYEGLDADEHNEDKLILQGDPWSSESTITTVTQRALGGGTMQWYRDEQNDRYEAGDAEADPDLYTATQQSFSLHGELSEEHQKLANAEAKLIIKDNVAESRGGGIATNSPIIMGLEGYDESVTVEKVWEGSEDIPESVEVTLVRTDVAGNSVNIQTVTLNEENEWNYIFEDLPGAYEDENGDLQKYTYSVTEATPSGWDAKIEAVDDNDNNDKTCKFVITNTYNPGSISVKPVDLTIYMGGDDGYDAVVGSDGEINLEAPHNSLPTPIFEITATDGTTDFDGMVFTAAADSEGKAKSWTAQRINKTDGTPSNYYTLEAAEGQDPVRVTYTDSNGNETLNDNFNINDVKDLFAKFTVKMYTNEVDVSGITAMLNGKTYHNVSASETGTLTVRTVVDTENNVAVTPVTTEDPTSRLEAGSGLIVVDKDTTYTVNNLGIPMPEGQAPSLLFDTIVTSDGVDRESALEKEVADQVTTSGNRTRYYQSQYLDLVDADNGNIWLKASKPVTVYWAYPSGTNASDDFSLWHFEGLHRDDSTGGSSGFDIDDINAETTNLENVEIEKGPYGISFTVEPGGFSPFVLTWTKSNGGHIPGGDDDPDTPALNKEDHYLYIEGYPEDYRTGEESWDESVWPVKPQGNITRAEVATIFYRLLKDEVREEIETDVNSFPDVNEDDWFNITVSSLANMGALSGYEDGTFRPNEPISRAELAAMAVRFYDTFEAEYEEGTFLDVDGDEWYADAIAAAEELGIIGGYPDGTVRPEANITRAETCAIVNRVLERRPHDEHLGDVDDMRTWPDNQPGAWYYADMQEATNGHYYEWIDIDGSKFEEWTEVDKDYDWTKR